MAKQAKKTAVQPEQPKKPSSDGPIIKRMKRLYDQANTEYQSFQPLLDEAFDYAIPFRKGSSDGKGQKRVNKAFDQTAIVGAFRFAGRLWQDFVSEEMFRLAPGDILEKKIQDELRPHLEKTTAVITGMASNGEFDLAFHEMALDLAAGTGAMYIPQGDSPPDRAARFVSVPH